MVTLEEYLKAKKIVEEYEEQEFNEASASSLYCIGCQALEEHDCFCDEEDTFCTLCGEANDRHMKGCPYYIDLYSY